MERPLERVVIVGASLAGLRAAEALRSEGFTGDVTVIGAERHRPYDRPPLSKKLLAGEWEPDRIALRRPDAFDELEVDWHLGIAAAGLDVDRRVIHLTDGEEVGFDGCIITTGATPRRLPEQGRFDHVHELRTVDDAMRLRAELLDGGRRVVVIGAGFIGLEVAATAHQLGNDVTVVEADEAPLVRGLGASMGTAIARLHTARGIAIRCGVFVDRLHDDGVRLAGGELLAADAVVVGIGVVPATGWLDDSGLTLHDGVVCTPTLQATREGVPVPGVYAAGDLLRWPHPLYGRDIRIEHWTNAAEQGAAAAKNLLAEAAGEDGEPYDALPFFWSDQADVRIQFLGRAGPDDAVEVVRGDPAEGKFLALYGRDGRVVGALGVNAPRWVMPMRSLLTERVSWDDACARAAGD
jgi:NADPH-dependent 2,4-dienoyl-CoA reductase/sulfur reductase-like enzyme